MEGKRYCTPDESLITSFQQVRDIQHGYIAKKSWSQFRVEEEEQEVVQEAVYAINVTPKFEEDIKYYRRKKKYVNIMDDLEEIISNLQKGIFEGDVIPGLGLKSGNSTYKVRAANTNAGVGKSNGYRLLYYVVKNDKEIYLLTVYSKKDGDRIASNSKIIELVNRLVIDEDGKGEKHE